MKQSALLLGAFGVCIALPAAASDELNLAELLKLDLVSTTKTKTSANEAPATITVLTNEQLAAWRDGSLAEALKYVVGTYVVDDHAIANLGFGGIGSGLLAESGNVKLMIDGVPVSFRPTAGNWLGVELVPMNAVERIEIVRGPTSSLYGADSFLGVINVILKSGEDGAGSVFAHTGVNSKGRPGGSISAQKSTPLARGSNNLAFAFDWSDRGHLGIPGSSPAPQFYPGPRGDAQSPVNLSASAIEKLTYDLSDDLTLGIALHGSYLERQHEYAPLRQLTNATTGVQGTRLSMYNSDATASLRWDIADSLNVSTRATLAAGATTPRDRVEAGSSVYSIKRNLGYIGVNVASEVQWDASESLDVVAGMDYSTDSNTLDPRRIAKIPSGGIAVGDELPGNATKPRHLANFGAFAQSHWVVFRRWLSATSGVRFDHHNIYGDNLSGRLALVSEPVNNLFVKLIWSNAFRAPAPLLLFGQPYTTGDIIGNPQLKPQHIETLEGNVRYIMGRLTVSTGVALTKVSDKAEFVPSGLNQTALNVSSIKGYSWQSEANVSISNTINAFCSFELAEMERDLNEVGYRAQVLSQRNSIYPLFVGRLGGTFRRGPWLVALRARVVGPRRSSDQNSLPAGAPYELGTYIRGDALLAYTLARKLLGGPTDVAVRGENLGPGAADPGFGGIDYPLAAPRASLYLTQGF